jgi:hypothetical protein
VTVVLAELRIRKVAAFLNRLGQIQIDYRVSGFLHKTFDFSIILNWR